MRRLLAVALAFSLPVAAQVQEQITVERILIDARITDYQGDMILGLTADDFQVKIDGKIAKIESVDWIPETAAQREIAEITEEESETPAVAAPQTPPPGRLFIYFIQTDFARNNSRLAGHLSFLSYAEQMIDDLEEGDRVALFSFDSHLKFRLDFTDDKRAIKDAMRSAALTNEPPPPQIVPNPSLARRLDRDAMKKAVSSDEAFILIANALRPIPGPKSLILFGWGLGHLVNRAVEMDRKYPIARYALESSRVTVFSIDTTQADYHDLEVGLQKAAEDTGGLYARAFRFPQLAVNFVERALVGHYELEVRRPDLKTRGTHVIEVSVARSHAYVYARSTFVDTD